MMYIPSGLSVKSSLTTTAASAVTGTIENRLMTIISESKMLTGFLLFFIVFSSSALICIFDFCEP